MQLNIPRRSEHKSDLEQKFISPSLPSLRAQMVLYVVSSLLQTIFTSRHLQTNSSGSCCRKCSNFYLTISPTISESTTSISATPLRMFGNLPLRPLSLKHSRDFPHTSHSGPPPGIGRTIHFQFWHRFDNNHTGRWCNLVNVKNIVTGERI